MKPFTVRTVYAYAVSVPTLSVLRFERRGFGGARIHRAGIPTTRHAARRATRRFLLNNLCKHAFLLLRFAHNVAGLPECRVAIAVG